jgi:hypothetical protein
MGAPPFLSPQLELGAGWFGAELVDLPEGVVTELGCAHGASFRSVVTLAAEGCDAAGSVRLRSAVLRVGFGVPAERRGRCQGEGAGRGYRDWARAARARYPVNLGATTSAVGQESVLGSNLMVT